MWQHFQNRQSQWANFAPMRIIHGREAELSGFAQSSAGISFCVNTAWLIHTYCLSFTLVEGDGPVGREVSL